MAKTKTDALGKATQVRAAQNRAIRQESRREQLKAEEYIRQIELVEASYDLAINDLDVLIDRRKRVKMKGSLTNDERERITAINKQIEVVKLKLDVYKQKVDLNFRRLKFVLPELKSIELTDPSGRNPFEAFGSIMDVWRKKRENDYTGD